jgi:hypothetical protein
VSLVGFNAQNHPQQTGKRGARPEVDNLATTPEVFDPLNERFRFTLDACALPHNAKVSRFYAPPGFVPRRCMWDAPGECPQPCLGCQHGAADPRPVALDGLGQSWAGERVWCNPPYSDIEPWVQKAHCEFESEFPALRAELIVMLVPANRTEQGWWQRLVEPSRDCGDGFYVEFLPGRLRFIKHGHDRVEPNQRPPFGCCLLIWGPDPSKCGPPGHAEPESAQRSPNPRRSS